MPHCTPVPNMPAYVRGVINLRGHVIRVIDLRLRLAMPSKESDIQAMVDMLSAREKDHLNWLQTLEASVKENKPFTLARDPSKCAFGKWYDNYKTEDGALGLILQAFDAPHRRIHAIADRVCAAADEGRQDEAMSIITQTRSGDLASMVTLFENTRVAYREGQKELAIVLEHEGRSLAIAVDSVESVERINDAETDEIATVMGGLQMDFFSKTIKRLGTQQIMLMLEPHLLMDGVAPVHA